MCELDITGFIAIEDPAEYSASAAELGPEAGKIAWNNAMRRAGECAPLLDTPDKLDAFRDHVRGFGAWEDEEIDAWGQAECEALLAQMIAADMREGDIAPGMSDAEWKEYEAGAEAGRHSGRISRGDDGRVYYYIGY